MNAFSTFSVILSSLISASISMVSGLAEMKKKLGPNVPIHPSLYAGMEEFKELSGLRTEISEDIGKGGLE